MFSPNRVIATITGSLRRRGKLPVHGGKFPEQLHFCLQWMCGFCATGIFNASSHLLKDNMGQWYDKNVGTQPEKWGQVGKKASRRVLELKSKCSSWHSMVRNLMLLPMWSYINPLVIMISEATLSVDIKTLASQRSPFLVYLWEYIRNTGTNWHAKSLTMSRGRILKHYEKP